MVMEFDSSRPIWQQLCDEFTRRIVTGSWQPGEKIPSVRELAVDVGANPNTVQRAMAELERQGLAIAERTAGRFVTTDQEKIMNARKTEALAMVGQFVDGVKGLHLTNEHVHQLINEVWNRHDLAPTQEDDQ